MTLQSDTFKLIVLGVIILTALVLKLTGFTLPEIKQIPPTDGRQIITEAELEKLSFVSCPLVSQFMPNVELRYVDENHGITFNIPYHPQWGTQKYSLTPWSADENGGLQFGPIDTVNIYESGINTCYLRRHYSFSIIPKRALDSIFADPESGETVTLRNISDQSVANYRLSGFNPKCLDQYLELAGTKANYLFSTRCGQNTQAQDILELEKIATNFEPPSN